MTDRTGDQAHNEGGDPLVDRLEASGSAELGEDLSEDLEGDPLVDRLEASGSAELGEDLSNNAHLQQQNTRKYDIQLDEWEHRKNMQISAFSTGLSFACLLYLVATVIGGSIAYGFVKGSQADWHLTLLAAAFIIPPTVIVIVLIRSVYTSPAETSASDNLPALNLIKEIAVAIKEIFSSSK